MDEIIVLESGGYTAKINATRGANCFSLEHSGHNAKILREPDYSKPLDNPFLYGAPVLFPQNRISGGKFEFEGRVYDFGINEENTNCYIHGALHVTPFAVVEKRENFVRLVYENDGTYVGYRDKFAITCTYFLSENGLDERPIVALLAGSRRSEIKDNLADMIAISRHFPDYQFVVAAVPWLERELYEKILQGSGVKVVCNKTYDTLIYAEAAIVTSGTATLETALMNTPEIVLYHVPKIYEWLRPIVLKIPFISLVNINLGRECVREIVVNKIDVEAVSEELRSILEGGSARKKMLADFAELQTMMGGEGSSRRVAADIVKSLK